MSGKIRLCKKILLIFLFIQLLMPLWAQTVPEEPIIAVLDFVSDEVSRAEVRLVVSMMSTSIYKTGRFKVLDISQRDNMMKELSFSLSSCSDESCQIELGRMLAAEMIVVGHIGILGSRYVLSGKILDTSSGATFGAEDGVYKDIDALVDDLDRFVHALTADVIALIDSTYGEGERIAQVTGTPATEPAASSGEETEETESEEGEAAGEPEEAPPPRVVRTKPVREPREPRERRDFEPGIGGTLAMAGGLMAAGIGGLDFMHAGWSASRQVSLSSDVYSNGISDFDNLYLGYLADFSALKESAAWGIGWTAGGAVLAGYGLYRSFYGSPEGDFPWRDFFLISGGGAGLLSGAQLITEAAGSLSRRVEQSASAYENADADADFDTLYAAYRIDMANRSSAFWRGFALSAGGLGSLGTGIVLNIMDTGSPGDFHWPGFLLLAGGAGALYGSVTLLAEAGGPLSRAVDLSSAIYLGAPADYDAAYAAYHRDFIKRSAAGWSGIGLSVAGIGLTGLGVWQSFFTPVPPSCGDWQGWLLTGSGAATLAWGIADLLIAALSLTPDVEAAAAAYKDAEGDFDLLYETYTVAMARRSETALRGMILTGAGAVAGGLGVLRLVREEEPPSGDEPRVSWMVLPGNDGFSLMAFIRI